MIYITLDSDSYISKCFEHKEKNLKESYKEYMLSEAKTIGIIINEHWFNIMDHNEFMDYLSGEEYKQKAKQWSKFRKKCNFEYYLKEIVKAKEVEFKINLKYQ